MPSVSIAELCVTAAATNLAIAIRTFAEMAAKITRFDPSIGCVQNANSAPWAMRVENAL